MVKALIFVPPDRLAEATKLIMEHLDTHIEVYFLLFFTKVLERKWDMFGLGIAIFYFSSEVEQFLHDYSIGSLCTINGVKKIFNALSALLGHFKVWLFCYFQGVFKNNFLILD